MYKLKDELQVLKLDKLVNFVDIREFTNNDNSFISMYIIRSNLNELYNVNEYVYLVKHNNIIKEVWVDYLDLLLKAKEINVMYLTHDNINEVAGFCNGVVFNNPWNKDYSSVTFKTKEDRVYTSCVINDEYFIKCDNDYVFCLKEEIFNFLLEEVKDN